MAIYLDEQTGPELKRLLKKEIERSPTNFIAPRILKSIEADDARKKKIADCQDHDWNPCTGKKTVCNLCGGKQDGFEEWTSNSFLRERGVDYPPAYNSASAIPHVTPTQPNGLTTL